MSRPYPEAVAWESKLSLLCAALIGCCEMTDWIGDEDLSRRVRGSLGRAIDVLRESRKVSEISDEDAKRIYEESLRTEAEPVDEPDESPEREPGEDDEA